MNTRETEIYAFGRFVLIPRERQLMRDGAPVPLAAKAFDLLVILVRNHGSLLGKEALLEEVWPGVIVEEVNLTVHISAIRKALGGNDADEWIETVPRHGYRFCGDVKAGIGVPLGGPVEPAAERLPSLPGPSSRRALWALVGTIAVIGIAALLARAAFQQDRVEFKSMAVLPFVAENAAYDDVAQGLVEETINRLAGTKVIRVAPRTSTLRYKNPSADVQSVGRTLGVDAVVTGRVALRNEALEIQVDLIDVARGSQVWGERYRGRASDLAHFQGRIAQDLLRASGAALTQDQTGRLARPLTQNADAYRAYLNGRFYWNQRTEEDLKKAIQQFERAVQLDERFAAAYSGLADAFTTLGFLSYLSPASSFVVAERHAKRAVEIDPALAEPHASLGYVKLYYYWDWKGAETEFKRAIELNDSYATTHQWYSVFLLAAGRPDEALKEILLAQERDPLSLPINTDVGFHHYYNRRYESAVKQLTSVLEMKNDFPLAHLWLGRTFQELKQYPRALEEYRLMGDRLGDWPVTIAARGYVNGIWGRIPEARQDLLSLEKQAQTRFVTSYGVALIHAGLGDNDAAFRWLDKAVQERSHWLVWLRLDPRWDSLRSDPRFERLVRRMEFPRQSKQMSRGQELKRDENVTFRRAGGAP